MPKDGDFKRLVRRRMKDTGERYTAALAALRPHQPSPRGVPDENARRLIGQLADVTQAGRSHDLLMALPEPERRAAALEGLGHENWRVRRTSAQLLDRVDLTAEAISALTRALDDDHPEVRRKAVHTLSCEHCKPSGCVPDVRRLLGTAINDPSSIVRSMVVHVCSLHYFDAQWAIDVVADVAISDASAKLRAVAVTEIRRVVDRWDSDDRRRELPLELVRKTERHAGRWVAVRDGRIVAVRNGQARVFRREVQAGAARYWIAPPEARRPVIPAGVV